MEQNKTNPLLDIPYLPTFSAIQAEHVIPALETVLQDNRAWLADTLARQTTFTWESLITPMNEAANRLERMWSPVSHMNAVVNTDALRQAYNTCLPTLSDYHTEVGQNPALYTAVKAIREQDGTLNNAQRKSLDDSLLGFKLSGIALSDDEKAIYRRISQELSQLTSRFSDNVLDATNAWTKHITDIAELAGLPESALAMAAQTAQQRGLNGWLLTLQFPSYIAVMTYADNRELRAEMYRAYTTRASELGANPDWDNTAVMRDVLRLRQEEAELLGYANYAELSLATKMAENPQQVLAFLNDLAHKAKPYAQQEYAELLAFASTLGLDDVQAWDVTYVSEKMKQSRFDFSEEDLKPYFPADRVIAGLFAQVEKLFGVRIEQQHSGVDLWHADVRFYHVYAPSGELQAVFYLDLYARQHKRGGAWMSDFCGRFRHADGRLQIPVAFMTCNGSAPVGEQPALLTHDEVVTLFHEFGHGLHHMLTQVDYPDIAGIAGVEWDAVELPSQFMENWCWERSVLDQMAAHWQTGEPLPEALFQKMLAARHFQTAMATVRQLEFALFDMHLHLDPTAAQEGQVQAIRQQVLDEVAVIKPPAFNRMPHTFTHVFAGGYAAGYYSYKWAEVLSADAFARFEEEGLDNPAVGQAFLREVLEVGGSRPAMESFVAFRGRKPTVDALLRHSGLAVAQA